MKTYFKFVLILLFFSASCKKEDVGKQVFAGVYDSTSSFTEFTPPHKVNGTLNPLTNCLLGADSIDINMDGNFDLIIKQRIFLDVNLSNHITTENYPYCWLTVKNGLEFASKLEKYATGHGQYGTAHWVDTLNYEMRIDDIPEWSGTNTTFSMWVVPPTSFWGSFGCWYALTNEEKYIGIRMKVGSRYKYGWIKVNEISRENISFVSFALEK